MGLVLATALWFAGSSLAPLANAAGLTSNQVDSILSLLQSFGADQATINNVQAALTGQPVTTTPATTGGSTAMASYTFSHDLTVGSRGADVTALQQFLVAKGDLVMPTGVAYGYFGSLTKDALAKFQAANNISPAAGYFGPITMKAVNAMEGSMTSGSTSGSTTGGTVVSGVMSVALASDSPAAGTVVSGQAAADFTNFVFSNGTAAPVTVTSLTVTRIGVSSDNTLTNVYLYVGNNRVTDGTSLVNSQAVFSNSSGLFIIPANSTVEASVRADVASTTAGQSIGFAVMSASDIAASGGTFTGTYPVQGSLMNVANVQDLAGVSMSGAPTPNDASQVNAGTMNAIVWSEPVSVSQRTVYLKYARFREIGSVQTDALQNIGLYLDGSQIATANMNSDGTVIFNMTSNPVSLNTGSHTLEVHADVVKGSSRTFSFSIQTPSDIVFTDSNYGVNITPSATFPLTTAQTTVQAGSISITTDPTFTTNQTLISASNVTLGQWVAKAYGEDMRVGSLQATITLTGTTTATDYINNIAVYVNGAQVGSAQNWTPGTGNGLSKTLTFGSGNLFTLQAGQSATIAVKGDTSFASTSTQSEMVTLTAPANSWQGLSSYTTKPTSNKDFPGQSLSFTSGSLTVAANPAYSNQTLASNVTKQEIASYVLQASNVDSVSVTQVSVNLGGSLDPTTYLSNLTISGNGISQIQPVLPQSSNTFPVNFTIQPGQSETINVYADVGNATGTVTSTMVVAARAVTSQAQVGNSANPATGQTISIGNGTLGTPVLVQSQSLQPQYVIGGVQNQTLATYNIVAAGGAANVTELDFSVSSASTSIVSIGVGGTNSTVAYTGSTGTADISGLSIAIPGNNYAGTDIPVTVGFAPVGPSGSASPTTSTLTLTGMKYTSGGTTITTSTLNVPANTVMLVASAPTLSVTNTNNSGLAIGQDHLFDFTLGSQGGTIQVATTTFAVSVTGVSSSTLANPQIYSNGSLLNTVTCTSSAVTGGFTVTCDFSNYGNITGTGQTFSLYANLGGTFTNTGSNTASVTTQLGSATEFYWKDVSGGSTMLSATNNPYLYNYPTAMWTVHN